MSEFIFTIGESQELAREISDALNSFCSHIDSGVARPDDGGYAVVAHGLHEKTRSVAIAFCCGFLARHKLNPSPPPTETVFDRLADNPRMQVAEKRAEQDSWK